MNLEAFKKSLTASNPPATLTAPLQALWYDGKEDWEMSHNIAQDISDENGSWIHAYLHRKEGDAANASYWYRRAGKPVPSYSLQKEWEELVKAMLAV